MLGDHDTIATIAVKDLQVARDFYEGVLGFAPRGDSPEGVLYGAGSGAFLVYPSSFAGTNRATAMSFQVPGDRFDAEVAALRIAEVDVPDLRRPRHQLGRRRRGDGRGRPRGLVRGPRRQHPQRRDGRDTRLSAAEDRSGRARAQQGGRRVDRGVGAGVVDVEVPHGAHPTRPDGIRAHALLEQGGDELAVRPNPPRPRRARRCWSRPWPRRRMPGPPPRTPRRSARRGRGRRRAARRGGRARSSPAAARMPTWRIPRAVALAPDAGLGHPLGGPDEHRARPGRRGPWTGRRSPCRTGCRSRAAATPEATWAFQSRAPSRCIATPTLLRGGPHLADRVDRLHRAAAEVVGVLEHDERGLDLVGTDAGGDQRRAGRRGRAGRARSATTGS